MPYSAIGSDAFTNSVGTALTAHNAKWTLQSGGSGLIIGTGGDNALGSVGGRSTNYWSDAVTATHYSQAQIRTSCDSKAGPAIRMASGALSYYYAFRDPADSKVYAGQTVAGSSTDWDAGQSGFADGDWMLLEVDTTTSTTIYLKKISSGVYTTVATYTGKSALSGGFVGVVGSGGVSRGIDAWEGGDVTATAAPNLWVTTTPLRY